MRIWPDKLVDQEFADLGTAGFSGTLNDRQFGYLRNQGLTGGLADMIFQWKVSGGSPPPVLDPATLFALGEQGAWFRTNQLSNNLTNTVSPSAVVAVGGTIGVMLDASQGYALGSELVTNGDFAGGTTGWTGIGGSTAVTGGALVFTASSGVILTNQATTYTSGRLYRIQATISGYSSGGLQFQLSNGGGAPAVNTGTVSANGDVTIYIVSNGNTTLRLLSQGTASLTIDNISVREISGNPVIQDTGTARGTLRQEAGPGAYFVEDDGGDTMNWTAPAGTYTVAYVIPDGTVTILTGQSLSGATDMLLVSQVVEYLAVNRALTAGETSGLTAYLQGVANP
jgi:hypothetical protein